MMKSGGVAEWPIAPVLKTGDGERLVGATTLPRRLRFSSARLDAAWANAGVPGANTAGRSAPVQAILKGLKKYGMFVADNGIDWAISVAPDERIGDLHGELRKIKGSAFEVVQRPQ